MDVEQATAQGRFLKYENGVLSLKVDGEERELGDIRTRQGSLTHEQKLLAVFNSGEWVKI